MKHTTFLLIGLSSVNIGLAQAAAPEDLRTIALKCINGHEIAIGYLIGSVYKDRPLEIPKVATVRQATVTIHTPQFDVSLPVEQYPALIDQSNSGPLQLSKVPRNLSPKPRSASQ